MAFFQARDSVFGYRFQIPLQNLSPPFSKYSVAQWAEVLAASGVDPKAFTHIQFGKIVTPGEPRKLTGMLDFYLHPSVCNNHGCDGALSNPGTPNEALTNESLFPQ